MTIPPSHQTTKKRLPWKTGITYLVMLVALSAFVIVGVLWLRKQITNTGYTTNTEKIQVIIGDDVLNIPANLIRFEQQRKTLTPEQVDLAIHWPSGEGYGLSLKQEFLTTGPDQKLVFIKLAKRNMVHDMSARLQPIYKTLFEGSSRSGPSSLTMQPLKKSSAYDGEELAIYQDGQSTWVARCHMPSRSENPTCLRDMNLGKQLSVTYRFPLGLLGEWNNIEQLVFKKVTGLLEQ